MLKGLLIGSLEDANLLILTKNGTDKEQSINYVRKIFRETNISNPLILTRTCAYQEVRNVSFSENFAYVLNGWPLRIVLWKIKKQFRKN